MYVVLFCVDNMQLKPGDCDLSDPRNRNHKSLAIANHNFEVASFSRRNRNEIAVLQVLSESRSDFFEL